MKKDRAYFISAKGYDEDNVHITYFSSVTVFTDKEQIKEIEASVFDWALKSCIENNGSVKSVHVVAFNKV